MGGGVGASIYLESHVLPSAIFSYRRSAAADLGYG